MRHERNERDVRGVTLEQNRGAWEEEKGGVGDDCQVLSLSDGRVLL